MVRTLWVKRRCQLVIRLKANKYYPELLSSLSSYINLLNFLNFKASAVSFWLLIGSKPLAPDPNLRPLAVLVLVLAFGQLFLGKVCRDPTALGWVARPWSLDRLFATLFVYDSGHSRNRSQFSSTLPRSRLSGLPSNHAQFFITILDCLWLYQAVFCWVCRAIMRDFSRSVGRWFDQSRPRLVDAFGTIFAIILLSGSKRNYFFRRQMITHPHQTSTRITCANRGIIYINL